MASTTATMTEDPGAGSQPVQALGALAGLGLLAALFAPTLRHFAYTWSSDDNYSHGFLVPFISLYFAREAARRGPIAPGGGAVLGSALLGLAVLGRLATILVPVGIVNDGALVLGLAGLIALLGGSAALGRFGFALGFLVFMIPLPVALYAAIASPLQDLVSRLGAALLEQIGIPVLRQGNMMTLPGGLPLFVAEACSGMRQLTGFLALTTAGAYLWSRPAWHRAAVIASAIPIALLANVLRVTLTGVIMYNFNPRYASGEFHTVEGLLMMGVGLALLGLECRLLDLLAAAVRPVAGEER
jgi:exosortase